MTAHRCGIKGCGRFSHPGRSLCTEHAATDLPVHHRPPRSHDEIAARLDPNSTRDRWDVWDDAGLEAPGGGDEWD